MANQEKLYYSIKEVSQITGIPAYTLRYWEKEFPKLKPKKSKKGQRTYTRKDIDIIKYIKELLYERGYTIKGARDKLKNHSLKKEETKKTQVADLRKPAEFSSGKLSGANLIDLRNELLSLREKIISLIEKEKSFAASS